MPTLAPSLSGLAKAIDLSNATLGRFCAWLTLFLVLGTTCVVVLRYGFGIGATALQEAVMYCHALIFLGASGWALQENAHVRVDILHARFSPRTADWVEIAGTLLLLVPFCVFLGWVSFDYVSQSWASREGSAEIGGLAFVYLQKSLILLLVASLLLQGLAQILHAALRLAQVQPPQEVQHG